MAIDFVPGNGLPLEANLEKAPAGTRYVRAYVTDQNGVAISGSPVDMTSVDGRKFVGSITGPDLPIVRAVYRAFFDAGYVNEDQRIGDGEEVFQRVTETGGSAGS